MCGLEVHTGMVFFFHTCLISDLEKKRSLVTSLSFAKSGSPAFATSISGLGSFDYIVFFFFFNLNYP